MARDVKAETVATGPGGGAFQLRDLTLGVFLVDQPHHRIALGRDRAAQKPLMARDGWILPKGAEGLCTYPEAHRFLAVTIPARLAEEMGGVSPGPGVVGALPAALVELALLAPGLASEGQLYRQTLDRALVAQVLRRMGAARTTVPGRPLDDRRLERARALIHDRLAADLGLEDLAREAGMSGSHFARAFRAATGQSPLQYVIGARIEAAQTLMRTTRLPLTEIAWRVGYADASRFGEHFRRRVGATPASWRAD